MNVQLSLSIDFLKAFAKIPVSQQARVQDFVRRFQENPKSPGINYEKIHNAADPSLRSVRIDQCYRAIISHPSKTEIYLLLWVDKHDSAYQWAERRQLAINPYTGALQILTIEERTVEKIVEQPTIQTASHLFDLYSDQQLCQLGVPQELLGQVRNIENEDQLDILCSQLPVEAYSGLFSLACGYTFEQALEESQVKQNGSIDTTDFWAALNNDNSRSRFTIIKDAQELEEWLNAPLDLWRVFLHPQQLKTVQMKAKGPICVRGMAGTGKTIVAIHRAQWLAQHVFNKPGDKILFTTYTTTLAADIQDSLSKICSPEELSRIEVVNLDRWTQSYLEQKGYNATYLTPESKKQFWKQALELAPPDLYAPQFYTDEWNGVIQAQSVFTLDDYLSANRAGRGRRLGSEARKAIWPVFEKYRQLLNIAKMKEPDDFYRDATVTIRNSSDSLPYKAVIADEVQDFSRQAMILLRTIVPEGDNDLFIVGDAHQRIYGSPFCLSDIGIKIKGRSRKLYINYRTTEETRRFADHILTGQPFDNLDGEVELLDKSRSVTNGPQPVVQMFSDRNEENQRLVELISYLKSQEVNPADVCVVCRTNELCCEYEQMFTSAGVSTYLLSKQTHDESEDGVRIATMHRVKGIEFDYVIVVSATNKYLPLVYAYKNQDNTTDAQAFLQKERSLFYVALTRARKAVYILGYGTPSSLIPMTN